MVTKIIPWAAALAIPTGIALAVIFHPAWLVLTAAGAILIMAGG